MSKKSTYTARFEDRIIIIPLLPGGEEELEDSYREELGFELSEREFTFTSKTQLLKNLSAIFGIAPKHFSVGIYDSDPEGVVRVTYASGGDGKPLGIPGEESEYIAEITMLVSKVPSKGELAAFEAFMD